MRKIKCALLCLGLILTGANIGFSALSTAAEIESLDRNEAGKIKGGHCLGFTCDLDKSTLCNSVHMGNGGTPDFCAGVTCALATIEAGGRRVWRCQPVPGNARCSSVTSTAHQDCKAGSFFDVCRNVHRTCGTWVGGACKGANAARTRCNDCETLTTTVACLLACAP